MRFASVIVAAGSAARFGGDVPKQWRLLGGRPVVRWSLEALLAAGSEAVVLVVGDGRQALAAQACAGLDRCRIVVGGALRQDSVRAGLEALAQDPPDAVLVHDAARPFLETTTVAALLAALVDADGALPGLPVTDTLKRVDADGLVAATLDRSGLWSAQTPQAFGYARLREAYAAGSRAAATDDATLIEALGGRVVMVAGSPTLLKITYPEDMTMAERLASGVWSTRVGMGLDAHVFGPGDGVWLCGVHIPHDRGLIGHSDADAGLHALTDAVLGALALGDIGDHFPPTDPRWKGAASDQFLTHAVGLVQARGGRLVNVDVTLVCEAPKIKPHREAMRHRLSEILGLPLDRVSVKATTMERMGFTGREEGLAAQACASVETPA